MRPLEVSFSGIADGVFCPYISFGISLFFFLSFFEAGERVWRG